MIRTLRARIKAFLNGSQTPVNTEIPGLAREIERLARELQSDADSLPPSAIDATESLRNARLLLNNLRLNDIASKQAAETLESAPAEVPDQTPEDSRGSALADDGSPGPIARDLISLRDSLSLNEMTADAQTAAMLHGINDHLGRILTGNGIESIEDSGAFDWERHRVIETTPTDDPEKDKSIEKTVRFGYLIDGRVHRPQEVVMYAYSGDASDSNRE